MLEFNIFHKLLLGKADEQIMSTCSWSNDGILSLPVFIYKIKANSSLPHDRQYHPRSHRMKHIRLKTRLNIGIRINSHDDKKFCSLEGSTGDTTKMLRRIVIAIATDIFRTYWK